MATVPARSPSPQRRPAPSRPRTARLRVLPGGAGAQATVARPQGRRRTSAAARNLRFLIVSAVVLAALVFALVLLNIMVVQKSFELGDLQSQVTKAQTEHRKMRFEVARAEAPQKVAEAAAGLGLTVPTRQEYLLGETPSGGAAEGLAGGRDPSSDLRVVEGRLKAVQRP